MITFYQSFFHPTEEKIISFRKLRPGWHYGEGASISRRILELAQTLHTLIVLEGFPKTNAFPGLNGEIEITAYSGENYFAIELSPSGWSFSHERDDVEALSDSGTSIETLMPLIKDMPRLCSASEYSLRFTGTTPESASTSWRSSLLIPMEGSPLLTQGAF